MYAIRSYYEEAPGDLFVGRVETQREVGGQHGGHVALGRVVGIRNFTGTGAIFRSPLLRPGGALGQLPFVAEQVLEEEVAPLGGRLGPGDLQAAGDGVTALAGAETALPAQALFLDAGRFRLGPHQRCITGAVGLARITSYNVCYTKLLRALACMMRKPASRKVRFC